MRTKNRTWVLEILKKKGNQKISGKILIIVSLNEPLCIVGLCVLSKHTWLCCRLKQQKLNLTAASTANPQASANPTQSSGPSLYPPSLPKHKTSDKTEKADKQSKRPATIPFHHRLSVTQETPLEQDSPGGPQLGGLVALEPPMEPLAALPSCKYPKPLSNGRKAPESLLHSPMSPLPPTLSPHPVDMPVCPDGALGMGMIASETAVYTALLRQRENGAGWWRGFRTPRTDKTDFRPPELPSDKLEEVKTETATEGAPLKRSLLLLLCVFTTVFLDVCLVPCAVAALPCLLRTTLSIQNVFFMDAARRKARLNILQCGTIKWILNLE